MAKPSGVLPLTPTFSPQGDGNDQPPINRVVFDQHVVDPYLFPARGRKLPLLGGSSTEVLSS